ncbi:glycoside hydrolase family 2 TIM barrel-domain containing protein [Alistipes sp.]|uniref:glycoside hydrolase family 2 TIM barrel-domain containing protein n=1 Tax=Alistipes sp. TaxID=1872444 RepID=UPI003AEFCC3E
MRSIFSIIALFSLLGLRAQPYQPSRNRELPRGEVLAYPTQQAATARDGGDNRYFTRLSEWTRRGNVFTAPFTVPFAWANRQVLFRLGSASADYAVRVNGREVAYNSDGNLPAEFNLTQFVREGRNTLEIVVSSPSPVAPLESWKSSPAPAIGQAWVMSQPTLRIRDVLVRTWRGGDAEDATAEIGIVVKSSALNPRTSRIYYELLNPAGEQTASGFKDITLDMRREDTLRFLARIPLHQLWSAELPTRYTLRLKTRHEGRYAEYLELPVGFRTIEMNEGRMAVNGQPVALRVREVSPQIGEEEIAVLREQGYNTLKLLPGAVRPGLYDFCDMQGLYVIAQAPVDTCNSGPSRRKGGNPSNDPTWQGAFIERAEDSYHTSKRHPSVIAFSLAEESANGINLYESYLNMKRFGDERPFIYPDAGGEWNSDPLTLE